MSMRPKNAELRSMTDRQVVGATYYQGGYAEIQRNGIGGAGGAGGRKQDITTLSAKSRNKLLFTACTTSVEFGSMITLTYGAQFPLDGVKVKSHLSKIVKRLKRWGIVDYIWFLEFQKRTAPHFHILVDYEPTGTDNRNCWLGRAWSEVIEASEVKYSSLLDRRVRSHKSAVTMSNSSDKSWEKVRTDKGAVRYLAKYALKTTQKTVPDTFRKVGRYWGTSKGVVENKVGSIEIPLTATDLRIWLNAVGHTTKDWDVIPKLLYGLT